MGLQRQVCRAGRCLQTTADARHQAALLQTDIRFGALVQGGERDEAGWGEASGLEEEMEEAAVAVAVAAAAAAVAGAAVADVVMAAGVAAAVEETAALRR